MSVRHEEIGLELCRPIEPHGRLVMAWRNDPDTLAASFHSAPKIWDSFWPEFQESYFGQPALPPLFALLNGERVGFVRFRPLKDPSQESDSSVGRRCVDISVILAPAFRGRGLAAPLIAAAARFIGRHAGIDRVVAEVRTGNAGSVKAFERAGFQPLGESIKRVPDTGEDAPVTRHALDLTGRYWSGGRVRVIAEAGSNWRMGTPARDRAMARALVDVAVEAGADAVKFQTYRAETVYVGNAGQSEYLADAGFKQDISDIFADLAMPYDMIPELAAYARECGIGFMSTPFSPSDFAAIDPHVEAHKIASYEISHPHLLRLAAESGKPLVLSTGASGESDIAWAVDSFRAAGGRDLCLLQCTAKYPAPMDQMNLRTIPWLQARFGVSAGLSDHSRDPVLAPLAAVALGARVIEKHYTLDNRLPGPDHSFAILPGELKQMVDSIRAVEQSLGDGVKSVLAAEEELADYARRGVQATRDIAKGELFREDDNIAVLRPGLQLLGAHPRHLPDIEGRVATRDIAVGSGVRPDDWADGQQLEQAGE
jgi:sialic acid synthase SpsE/RimJ/RimL family protein N-acetyltransferase